MSFKNVSLDSLSDIDFGKGAESFKLCLKRAALDCADRPSDATPRKVTLELELTPVLEPDLTCTEIHMVIKSTCKVPVYRTKTLSVGFRHGGSLVFNPDAPENFRQGTFVSDEEEED